MDTKTDLTLLYHVQQQDSAMDALKRQYSQLDQGKLEQAAQEAAKAANKAATAALHAAEGSLKDTELEQKTVEAKRASVELKLYSGSVSAPKELQSLQDETEMLGRQRDRLDEKILILVDELELRRTEATVAKQALSAATAALKVKVLAFNSASEKMRAEAQTVANARAAAAREVSPAMLKRYDTLRATKGGIAIVPIEDGNACGGCKMGLPSTTVTSIRQGQAVILCDYCVRILCEKPAIAAAAAAAA